MYNNPIAYFITFSTYGTWLHGDPRSSVMRENGRARVLPENTGFYHHEQAKFKASPVLLDNIQRQIVRDTIVKHCEIRQWRLFALHVRTNHVHTVVKANKRIDQVANELKGWPKRVLREEGFDPPKVWTGGSSKVYIYSEGTLREKIHYVVYEQGEMVAYYVDEAFLK
ncbi:MAG: transposase [Phycisphaerae bacterium]|nr:transposase [Phycisphaerae bacterium]